MFQNNRLLLNQSIAMYVSAGSLMHCNTSPGSLPGLLWSPIGAWLSRHHIKGQLKTEILGLKWINIRMDQSIKKSMGKEIRGKYYS